MIRREFHDSEYATARGRRDDERHLAGVFDGCRAVIRRERQRLPEIRSGVSGGLKHGHDVRRDLIREENRLPLVVVPGDDEAEFLYVVAWRHKRSCWRPAHLTLLHPRRNRVLLRRNARTTNHKVRTAAQVFVGKGKSVSVRLVADFVLPTA